MSIIGRRKKIETTDGPFRYIELISIDGRTVSLLDGGCAPDGTPSSSRSRIANTLKLTAVVGPEHLPKMDVIDDMGKRSKVKKQPTEPAEVRVFRLSKPPTPIPWNLADKKQKAAASHDRFDRDVLQGDGVNSWAVPDAEWLEISDLVVAAKKEQAAGFHAKVANMRQAEGLEAILELVANIKDGVHVQANAQA